MADYYTQLSEVIHCPTKAAQLGLIKLFKQHDEESEDEQTSVEVEAEDKTDVWIHGDEYTNVDAVLDVLVAYQLKYKSAFNKPIRVEWACTASRPIANAFGGGGAVVYQGKAYWMNSSSWSYDQLEYLGITERKFASTVDVSEDEVRLMDGEHEIVCWVKDEWEADPSIVPAIVNAIKILYERGPKELRDSIAERIVA